MILLTRLATCLAATAATAVLTAAIESVIEASSDGFGPVLFLFVVLFGVYGFVAFCVSAGSNLLWLVLDPFLKRFEALLLPA